MALEPVHHKKVCVIDIDGTVFKKRSSGNYFQGDPEVLEGALEVVNNWYDAGYYIVFWTSRPNHYRKLTADQLDKAGFRYHELLMDKPYTHDMEIFDDNLITTHQVERDIGIGEYIKYGSKTK